MRYLMKDLINFTSIKQLILKTFYSAWRQSIPKQFYVYTYYIVTDFW